MGTVAELKVEPKPTEVARAVGSLQAAGMAYPGLLRKRPQLLMRISEAHESRKQSGDTIAPALRALGDNFIALLAKKSKPEKDAILEKLDAVFARGEKIAERGEDMASVLERLISHTQSHDALHFATLSGRRRLLARLRRAPSMLRFATKPQSAVTPREENEAAAALAATGMPYAGVLRRNPGLLVALHGDHMAGALYPAELRSLGEQLGHLFKGKNTEEKQVVFRRLDVLFASALKKVSKRGDTYPAFSHLMTHTASPEAFEKATKTPWYKKAAGAITVLAGEIRRKKS